MKKQEKPNQQSLFSEEKFKPVWKYDFIENERGYVEVYDADTNEFLFRDDTSALAKEFIMKHQI